MLQKEPLIIIAGPTAVGKTASSIRLAKAMGGEIISADSMQVYKGMDIGSAKIRPDEMDGIPHYLIDIQDPKEPFDVARFQQLAKEAMNQIRSRGKIPILVGGTGFYIQSVLYDIDFTETEADPGFRRHMEALLKEKGAFCLHQLLEACDPVSAGEIHENNVKRVIRALEFYHQTGTPISAHNAREKEKQSPYRFCYFVLNTDRDVLYQRIDARVDQMLADGLLAEVEALKKQGLTKDDVSMQGLGYKEMLQYLSGECTYEEAVYILKRDTRHFAKRQLTWFRHTKDVTFLHLPDFGDRVDLITEEMIRLCRQQGIFPMKEQDERKVQL